MASAIVTIVTAQVASQLRDFGLKCGSKSKSQSHFTTWGQAVSSQLAKTLLGTLQHKMLCVVS